MPSQLTNAAQAVMDAYINSPYISRRSVAAVLRAASSRTEDLIGDSCNNKFAEGVYAAGGLLDSIASELDAKAGT
jgi:hypothetical protein